MSRSFTFIDQTIYVCMIFSFIVSKLFILRYLDWGHGRKTLPLNQIIGILLEMKHKGKQGIRNIHFIK